MSSEEIFNERKNKFLRIGRNKGFMSNIDDLSSLNTPKENFNQLMKSRKFLISTAALILISLGIIINIL